MKTDIIAIKNEINTQIADKEVFNALLTTTFNNMQPQVAKRAMLEGAMRGFTLEDFLQKNIYAIPFKGNYSLVTSIDYARKIGMRSGVVGKSSPVYAQDEEGKIISCSVTIQKKIVDHVGDFTAEVFFDEYYKAGRNGYPSLWDSKPRTMIAKVAEMHALRMACPEELSQSYLEEEYNDIVINPVDEELITEIDAIETLEELQKYYESNKGRGKEFDKYVTKRKHELQDKNSQ